MKTFIVTAMALFTAIVTCNAAWAGDINRCDTLQSFDGYLICSTPHQTSDVVARQLQLTGAGWAGHVGIYIAPTHEVLEVLDHGSVIYKNSFETETWGASYWGVRYWARSEQSSHVYPQVVDAGWEQRNWNPSYTLFSSYTVGGLYSTRVRNPKTGVWETRWSRRNAKFRCDTFVVFSFARGLNLGIARTPQLPTTTYAGLPYNYYWAGLNPPPGI